MLFQMRFRMLSTLLLSLIVPAGSASADMRFNFKNCSNSWAYTRLGKMDLSENEVVNLLSNGDVSIRLTL